MVSLAEVQSRDRKAHADRFAVHCIAHDVNADLLLELQFDHGFLKLEKVVMTNLFSALRFWFSSALCIKWRMGAALMRGGCMLALVALSVASTSATLRAEPPPGSSPVPTEEPEDEVGPEQEHLRRIDGARKIASLGQSLFGDEINDYTGAVQFSVTDVSVPGNSALPVAISRRFDVNEVRGRGPKRRSNGSAFRDWDMDLPHLHGIFADSTGWQAGTTPNLRCAQPDQAQAAPPHISGFEPDDYWQGNLLYVPGRGDDEILYLGDAAPDRPTDGLAYRWVTKGLWYFSCLPGTANGVAGDSFLARDPEGNKYWFNQIVERKTTYLRKGLIDPGMKRKEVWILPTRVEDRFGNWVTYTYRPSNPWDLLSIDANDGRRITLEYAGVAPPDRPTFVHSVSDGTRTWTYQYVSAVEGGRLVSVIQPDQSALDYDFFTFHDDHADIGNGACGGAPSIIYALDFVARITHPSGAVGTFTFNYKKHGRTYVPKNCWTATLATGDRIPPAFTSISLAKKVISGAGLSAPSEWRWTYPALSSGYTFQCNPTCPTSKSIDITQPDGSVVRQTFGIRYGENEGMLLATDIIASSGTLLRSKTIDYRTDPTGQPYVSRVGSSVMLYGDPGAGVFKPVIKEQTTQQGTNFGWQVDVLGGIYSFDRFARPLRTTSSSSLGYSKRVENGYFDQTGLWVLHQQGSLTVDTTQVSRTDYFSSTALPEKKYLFGLPESTMTYHADGNPHTVKDGLNQITTLSDYHRGIARLITLADSSTLSADVNTRGLITQVTNQNGYGTDYQYDEMGRLQRVIYPQGDLVNWNDNNLAFVPSTCEPGDCELFGLPVGHWIHTSTTGTGTTTTHYDAFWRPVLTVTEDSKDASTRGFVVKRYDSKGREAFSSYPVATLGSVDDALMGVRTFYDALDRVKRVETDSELGVLVTTTEYLTGFKTRVTSPGGQPTATNPNGYATTTSFQAYDVPSLELPVRIEAPEGVTTIISRDVFGKPLAVTRSGPG